MGQTDAGQRLQSDTTTAVDQWWEEYEGEWNDLYSDLTKAIKESNRIWDESNCRFNQDPVATQLDWEAAGGAGGPLRVNQEENWSQWLAYLLRASDGLFVQHAFASSLDTSPHTVNTEVHLPNAEKDEQGNEEDRRADILTYTEYEALSIEVKKGDENYGKTVDTVKKIERKEGQQYNWTHVLLLQKSQEDVLRSSDELTFIESDEGEVEIRVDDTTKIQIHFWKDIAASLRDKLLDNAELNPHWESSGYLLVAAIEQHLLDFIPTDKSGANDDIDRDTVGDSWERIETQKKYFNRIQSKFNND